MHVENYYSESIYSAFDVEYFWNKIVKCCSFCCPILDFILQFTNLLILWLCCSKKLLVVNYFRQNYETLKKRFILSRIYFISSIKTFLSCSITKDFKSTTIIICKYVNIIKFPFFLAELFHIYPVIFLIWGFLKMKIPKLISVHFIYHILLLSL